MFKGKTILVTGASKGIGRSIALEFARLGGNVCINYSSSNESALEVLEATRVFDCQADIFKSDISDESSVKNMFDEIEKKFGTVDILVNNAGITKDNILMRMKSEEWDNVLNINLKGAFNCIKAASKGMMKKRYGKIINISSVVAFTGNIGQANYISSKAGLIGLTKSSAIELAPRGIRVNAIAPGFIETDMTKSLTEDVKNAMLSKILLGYFGKPEDIAKASVFLASPDSDYITGTVLHINGGMFLG
ncbi:MAG: 3-oxoacyl-[acyl-carrier-protein] reductase [Calditerrivibrio sp.]|nr:3-oxoacyl-[acyl-carrier-protein] reductase [Calditerrivibrio sp.]MCA1933794.1 3-oxoacyl-[acyl-carrier-protein] reductase [Calditerrivibrio sp.]MCA1980777.1 3-oxoacyl-[acyl-carrier-protein] reductase [Calditerrivibrio sp.]